jgi:hypothetical protein
MPINRVTEHYFKYHNFPAMYKMMTVMTTTTVVVVMVITAGTPMKVQI